MAVPSPEQQESRLNTKTHTESATSFASTPTDKPLFIPTQPEELFEGSAGSGPNEDDASVIEPLSIPSPDDAVPDRPWTEAPSPPVYSGSEEIQSLHESDDTNHGKSFRKLSTARYSDYRFDESSWTWLPGSGQDFGWLSFQGTTYQPRGKKSGVGGNFGLHLLGGPMSSPVPPRLYDFALGLQTRDSLSDQFSYDLATSIGVYSDFEDSARDGVRFSSHAVGMLHVNQSADLVFGLDYLDRDDIALLPVIGVSLRDPSMPRLRFDLVFPRPRMDFVLSDTSRIYLSGSMDGGTWDIEFPDESNPVMTYRDYRLVLGFERVDKDGDLSAWEFGYVFGRQLEFRNNPVSTHFDDAFMLRWVWRR